MILNHWLARLKFIVFGRSKSAGIFGTGRTPTSQRRRSQNRRSSGAGLIQMLEDRVLLSTLGTTSLVEAPTAGSDSDLVMATGAWTATTNSSWITLNTTSGTGNGSVNFSFSANAGATRSDSVTIAGQTLTVTQAGAGYVAAAPTILVPAVLAAPSATAVDGAGNVYIADHNNSEIKEWHAATGTVTTLVSTGLKFPTGVAVDGSGNVYISDTGNNAIKEWNAATGTVTTLVSTGLNAPERLAVDGAGNVYFADAANNAIKEWHAATGTVTTLVSTGLNGPRGVAVDGAGNVYIADTKNNAIEEWKASTGTVITLVGLGLTAPLSVAVDGSGNVYFVDGTGVSEWHLATQTVTSVLSAGLSIASDVAVDGSGNVFISDRGNNAIKEWKQSTGSVTTLVSSVLAFPNGLSLDSSGNVYIADINNNAIKEWQVSTGAVKTIVSSGLNSPTGVAVDGSGNLYITSNTGALGLQEWIAATGTLTAASGLTFNSPKGVAVDGSGNVYIADTLFSSIYEWIPTAKLTLNLGWVGLKNPAGIAVDGSGNIYVADTGNNAIKEWNATTHAFTTLVSTGLNAPIGVAVDSAGNVYIADSGNNAIKDWNATTGTVTTLASTGLGNPRGVAVDGAGNVYVANTDKSVLEVLPPLAYVNTTAKSEASGAGTDQLSLVLPSTTNLTGVLAPTSDQSWLTIGSVAGGVVNFSFSANPNAGVARTANITLLGQTIAVTQAAVPITLGTTSLLEGPSAGSDSDIIVTTGAWTASTTASWITLNTTSGTGNGAVNFSFAADAGATRTGTLTIAGQTLTVTQAGAGYVAAGPTTLVAAGLNGPNGVAVDGAGNIYFADRGNNAIKEWHAATGTITTLVSAGLNSPNGVAVDGSGNVYIADTNNNAIDEWNPTTGTVTTLVSSGLNSPQSVALDGSGNLYIADANNNAIKEWSAKTGTVTTLVSTGLKNPLGVAVDASGNVYFADSGNNAIKEWNAVTQAVSTLVSAGLANPSGVSVDGSGTVYFADSGNNAIKKWNSATQAVTTLVSAGLNNPNGVVVDGAGNIYVGDSNNNAVKELPRAYLNTAAKLETSGAGTDQLSVVVPSTATLTGAFAPTSDQSWLTIGSVANGVVNFSFSVNPSASAARTANITLLGQAIGVTQAAAPATLGTTSLVEAPFAGNDSDIVLTAGTWTASTTASWITLNTTSGTGNGAVNFSFAANTGATRTGTVTIAGQTLTVTQAGTGYVVAGTMAPITGLSGPYGVAADASGNVYVSDSGHNAIKKRNAATGLVTTLVSTGLNNPFELAVDSSGNVYIADQSNNAIKKWNAATGTVTTLVSTGLNYPDGVAVDASGNVYIADSGNGALKEWHVATGTVTTLAGGLQPVGVAVDGLGNVYIADGGNNAVKEWHAATGTVTTLVTGVSNPWGVAVDGSGNVYIADGGNVLVKEWQAATGTVITLPLTGLTGPTNVAVDGSGNVYTSDWGNNAILELPRAYLNTTPVTETSGAGSDQLSVVVPSTANLKALLTPTSDQTWLTIGSVSSGVVNFSFSANPGISRTANIFLLGQTIPVTQAGSSLANLGMTSLIEGPSAGSDSDTVVTTGAWAASTTAPWITLNTTNGTGNGSVNFSFSANTGATRIGTVTIAGQTLTITQAGAGYVAAGSMALITGLSGPYGVAVDASGNVYASDSGHNAIKEWNAATGTVSTIVSAGLNNPFELSVHGSGNLYIADQSNFAIKDWNPATGIVTTLVSTGLKYPNGVAVDASGNVFIADSSNGALKEWHVATGTVTTLAGGLQPVGVAVDSSGNVFIADGGNNAVKEWHAATGTVTTLVTGLSNPWGVAVDGSGNVYIADGGNVLVKEWQAATGTVITLPFTGLTGPTNVAVDGSGNVYTSDWGDNAILELPRAYVNTTPVTETSGAGSDQLSVVVPSTAYLTGAFAPTSDQSWLTIGSVTNGVVNFNFNANPTNAARTAHIKLLGQTINLTQAAGTPPVVTTPTISGIANTSAVLGGNVTSDGGPTITERGVLYALTSVNPNPQLGGTGVTKATASGTTGVFTVNASGLTQGSVYSFVAYATNGSGTTYSPLGPTFVPGPANVTGVYDPSSNPISAGATLTASPNSLTASFSENMNSVPGGANSVTNPANWLLFRYGADVSYLMTGITFAQNPTSLKYLATVSFATPLNQGGYQLIARQAIQDISGRSLSGSGGASPSDFRLNFYVAQSVGATSDVAPYLYNIEPSVLNATATQSTPISSLLYVFDADSNNWTSATVQIGINYQSGEDVLGFTNTATPNITASWNAATGMLTLTGTDTVSNYRTALHNVTYTDTSATPNTALTRAIYFQANDGMLPSNVQTRDVTVSASSVPAALSGVNGTGTYFQGYPAIFLAQYLVITDPNVVNLSSATVSFTNWQGEDRLIFNNIFADQWTFTQDLAAHTATFTIMGADLVDHYQTLLRSVQYWDVSGAPTTSARVASFSVTDGFSTSNIVTRNTVVSAVNQPPTLSSIESTPLVCKANDPAYPAQPISNTLLVGDPDSNNLTKATVQITSGYENDANGTDILAFTSQLGITGSFNAATGTLTLTGTSSVSNYRTALRSVTFGTSGPAPSTATRTLTIYATDDYTPTPATSLSATRTVTVQATNLPPALSNIPNAPLAYVRNAAATAIAPGAVIYDPDSINVASATIQITGNYQTGLDVLAATVVSGITQSFDATTGTLTLSGISSLANYQSVLQSVTFYTPTGANTLSRSISLTLNDGLANSSTVARGVTLS